MNQKELWDEFGFKCDRLKDCRNVIQNEFRNGLTENEAKTLIEEFGESFEYNILNFRNLSMRIKEFIWSQVV